MASGVEELLGTLYDMIEDGKPVPMHSEQCKIDRDRALDLLDEIRAQFPVELGEAQKLVAAKEDYMNQAKAEGDALRAQAQDQVKRLLNENEIVRQARELSDSMVRKAQEQARELRKAATEYCESILKDTEVSMSRAAADLHDAQSNFRRLAANADKNG